ncbi:ABC transporter substrate-binding protein [Cereibacter azotoformans]|uniref:Peptide/nickel transport system substrate-binding protein n=1 Tax=Cereibacter azotoformans TaxID=43057 RepID=A0A2T5JVH8_9RHOB|nr:ABC transporter substrate-binding protein [Cereibacter azotoformans]AXQ94778.1 ABC transporter substrate-binding protein [Cereibacter sphaeroides]MBO4170363.1 ABC transporter substrate-binding protein [Cereibacter azotoformans]PTR14078.1 peptide/nickel transport system substrate-binding protein [Cereibacter azotoformans]UIJ30345.1 ABC transporter substrate-binding protein [Cereibacter azotoformans]
MRYPTGPIGGPIPVRALGLAPSRRAFLGGAAVLAGAFCLPASLRAEEGPKRGGRLRYGVNDGSQQDSLEPGSWATVMCGAAFNGALCNNLVELLPDGSLAGDLAERWEEAEGATRWTFTLRKGVTFHDRRPFTSEDARQSLLHHMGEDSTSGALAIVSQIKEIAVEGEDRLIVTLTQGNADFPYLLSDYHLSIFPAKEGGGIDWESGIGTGAFRLDSFEPGVAVRLVRNPRYHKPGLPHFDEVEFIAIPDRAARLNALLTGEVDVIEDLDIRNVPLIERNPDLVLHRTPSLRHLTFDMNCQTAPFDHPAVRQALKLSLDREDVIAKVFLGEGETGNDNPVARIMPFRAETPPEHRYDPEAARALLAEAGIEGLTVDLSVAESAFPGAVEAGVLFREHAARAGITINLVQEADDGYWDNVWLVKPFNAADWYGRVTLDWLFATSYTSDAPWNNTGFRNSRFDELHAAARSETDPTTRGAHYAEMQQILHDEGGVITVAFVSWLLAMSRAIGHGETGGILPADNHRCAERWWRTDI